MSKFLAKINLALAAALSILCVGLTVAPVYADGASQLQGGLNAASGQAGQKDSATTVNTTIKTVINILSVLVGIIAVIMIIVGGFRYITSGGDSAKVGSAKNTILYALIGLVIVALAQTIAQFVLDKATQAGGTTSSTSSSSGISEGAANSPH